MTPKDVKKYYKSSYSFSNKTGMAPNSFLNWLKWGYIPLDSQVKLEQLTNGELKATWNKALDKGKDK